MPDTLSVRPARALRVLGIDPSTVGTGRALLVAEGSRETVETLGVFAPPGANLDEKLDAAFDWMVEVIAFTKPDALAIETPFFKLNAQTMFTLASLGAVYRLAATRAGLPVIEIPPAKRCVAVGLAGNASKDQVRYTVNAVYGLDLTDHNMADAVAIAAAGALQLRMQAMTRGD